MEYILFLFLNGHSVEIEKFAELQQCQDLQKTFQRAIDQAGSKLQVWCEKVPL